MIDSLAQHGVLSADLAPSLVMTLTINNPDFDPEAKKEREEEALAEEQRAEEKKKEDEQLERIERERIESRSRSEAIPQESSTEEKDSTELNSPPPPASSVSTPSELSNSEESTSIDLKTVQIEEDVEEDEDDGDLGAPPRASVSSNRTSKRQSQPVKAVEVTPQSSLSEQDDEGGDIGALAGGSTPKPNGSTPLPESSSPPREEQTLSNAQPTTALTDPNTAAQTGLEAAGGMNQELGLEPKSEEPPSTSVLGQTSQPQKVEPPPSALEGVTTEISSADEKITLDLRWTILCDLFLVLTADSVYDARSRVLLLSVAEALGLSWMDVTTFEKRVTDALEIEEGVESLKDKSAAEKRAVMAKRRRLLMVGAATVGGGLVIGLSAGLLAPLIGAGLGATLGAVGIGGTSSFLGGVGGAAFITSTATLGGATIGGRSMSRRTRNVKTFEFRPLHNNKRVNAIVTVPG